MKELVFGLLILVSGEKNGRQDILLFTVESCYTWYQKNVEMTERKTTFFSRFSISFI